jgi:CheY-like chemotaxis protein
MHGGTVTAYSDGDGLGSEFVISLPALIERPASDRMPAASDGALGANGDGHRPDGVSVVSAQDVPQIRRRILVADDNADALESLATLLELGGHEVFSAANGALALEAAERHRPEVALLDIGMPKLDGYQVARGIRAQSWGRRMTLVALTGWGQDSDRRRSAESGFDSHLVKPLDLDKLTELLARLPVSVPASVEGGTPALEAGSTAA